ncbi:MAG: Phosphoenolpyruvate-protein phosphotransferase [Chlamydiae bacterium]|nr:Phosphoenolpyruvate-protein phosphotransferase [Chlamydiota bacterium]
MSSEGNNLRKEVRIHGVAVSEGISIGEPHFLQALDDETPDFPISLHEVDAEIARYRKAVFSSKEDLNRLRQDLSIEGSDEAACFIETHIQMLDDPMITTHMEGKIRQMLRNTESVFRSVINDYETRFSERTDSFFQERLIDVMDVSKRILGHLKERQDAQLSEIPNGSVVFSEEVTPSYMAACHAPQVSAFVTKKGGGNSHAALIARSKGIPYVVGVDVSQIEKYESDSIIVDGYQGLIIISPSEETVAEYEKKQEELATRYQLFLKEDHLRVETIDGFSIRLCVNVGNLNDLDLFPYEHSGVGLFRSEYLFLQSEELFPSEEFQEQVYRDLIKKVKNKPVVIRVFDLGGDKHPSLIFDRKREPNPVMGFRGIRFLLRNQQLFKMQLRAIHKAALGADVRLLLPLISNMQELSQAKEIIEEVRTDLKKEMLDVPRLPLGSMIEVPSAVMLCDALAESCDFLSMGTNDLAQYTLGVDRGNPAMNELYYPAHPSVLRMIKMVSVEAKRQEKPLSLCGEIASNTLFIPLLLGLGLRELSMAPRYIPFVKQTIRKWTIVEAYQLAEEALKLSDPEQVSALMMSVKK